MQGPKDDEVRSVLAGVRALGISLPDGAAERMVRHLDLVYEENLRSNLTRIPRQDAVVMHVLDSLAGLTAMERSPAGPWIDIGSGAGYPGIALSLATGRQVDLVESVGKKARFLESVCRELCPNDTVLGMRAEDAAVARGGVYSAVAARAVSELPSLIELAAPLLTLGGLLVCWKGEPSQAELLRGAKVAHLVGMTHRETTGVRVPGSDSRRCLVVYEKSSKRAIAPRRVGLAQSRPLA
jgi:16S rRNA (guanine527-N7)-methyltransferase